MEAKCKNKSAVQVELWNVLVNIYVTLIKALSFLISFSNDLKHLFLSFSKLRKLEFNTNAFKLLCGYTTSED